jgi:hypothetical protein
MLYFQVIVAVLAYIRRDTSFPFSWLNIRNHKPDDPDYPVFLLVTRLLDFYKEYGSNMLFRNVRFSQNCMVSQYNTILPVYYYYYYMTICWQKLMLNLICRNEYCYYYLKYLSFLVIGFKFLLCEVRLLLCSYVIYLFSRAYFLIWVKSEHIHVNRSLGMLLAQYSHSVR